MLNANFKGNRAKSLTLFSIQKKCFRSLKKLSALTQPYSKIVEIGFEKSTKFDVSMILSTTSTLEGHQVENYLGIVSGETIIGANIFKDFFASITDIVGGRSSAYEQVLREAKATAMSEMEIQARQLGANAIIGIDLDYETIREGMLMVTVSGTAVKVYKP